jgi:hypothetical protein
VVDKTLRYSIRDWHRFHSSYCLSGKLSRQPRWASLLHHRKSYAFARIHKRDEVVLQRILRTLSLFGILQRILRTLCLVGILQKTVCPSKRPYKKERLPNFLECTNKPLRVSSCFIAFSVLPVGRPLAIRSTRSWQLRCPQASWPRRSNWPIRLRWFYVSTSNTSGFGHSRAGGDSLPAFWNDKNIPVIMLTKNCPRHNTPWWVRLTLRSSPIAVVETCPLARWRRRKTIVFGVLECLQAPTWRRRHAILIGKKFASNRSIIKNPHKKETQQARKVSTEITRTVPQ